MRAAPGIGEKQPFPRPASNVARERSNLYGFLATVFWAEPDAPLFSKIREPAFAEADHLELGKIDKLDVLVN